MEIRDRHKDLVDALSGQARKLYNLRYQMSNGGNLSARIPEGDRMLVKGTDVDFASVDRHTLVVCCFGGSAVEGDIRPSKESLLHGAIYRRFPHVGAIMHCHSPWATAWANGHDRLDFATHHAAMKLGGHCPVFDTGSYVVPEDDFPLILNEIAAHQGMNAFLLRGHGQVTLGKTIGEAASLAELVEETAQIAILSRIQ